jgi:hypothetical protein
VPEVVVPSRFNGPPGSGNGGYTCGVLAELVGAAGVEVSLRLPPPLDRPLPVEPRDGGLVALDGGVVVAEAREATVAVDPPPSIPVAEALAADRRSLMRDPARHPFATCFVCGPDRTEGDGLRMFAGPVDDRLHATVFRPSESVADRDGAVRPEVVWAALDCPTSAPVVDWAGTGPPFVLARLAARIERRLVVGQDYVSLSWPLGIDGRKRRAASALYDAAGDVVAVSEALWIQLRPPTDPAP